MSRPPPLASIGLMPGVVLGCLLLAACQRQSASLSLSPEALPDCGEGRSAAVVEVRWDASGLDLEDGVLLWVNQRGRPRYTGFVREPPGKAWMKGAATGSAATGAWAVPGMRIALTDARSGRVLAQKRIRSGACR